jgi:hypothetical protein
LKIGAVPFPTAVPLFAMAIALFPKALTLLIAILALSE